MELTYHLNDIELVAETVLKNATSKTFLFYGDMGVGKTTLIKALSKQLGSSATITSPTFSIVNEYEIHDDLIYHFDLYRIKDLEEALNFGIEDYLTSDHYIFIEWPEKIVELLQDNTENITIKLNTDGTRTIESG